jgi:hypothetical protein
MVWLINRKLNHFIWEFRKTGDVLNVWWDDFDDRLDSTSHDLQQIKTRLTWSKRREKKDLKFETGGAKVYKKK